MTAPESWDPKIVSYGDVINPDWSKELRHIFELRHGGHFTVEVDDSPWTQAEIDAEWARQKAPTNMPVTNRSPAFVLNPNFKPEPEQQYHELLRTKCNSRHTAIIGMNGVPVKVLSRGTSLLLNMVMN